MGKTYKPLHELNGDNLGRLKRPICSEFSTTVQGKVNARKEEHRKRVELMFKDRNLVINRVKRSQDAVYRTLLRVHKQRKMLEKEQYKRQQDSIRLGFESRSQNLEIGSPSPRRYGNDRPGNSFSPVGDVRNGNGATINSPKAESSRTSNQSVTTSTLPPLPDIKQSTETPNPKPKPLEKTVAKTRVLEVRKHKEQPGVQERSLTDTSEVLKEPFPNIRDVVLPPEPTESQLDKSNPETDATEKRSIADRKPLPELKKTSVLATKPPPPKSYLKDLKEARGMEAISEEQSDLKHSPRSQRPEKSRKQSCSSFCSASATGAPACSTVTPRSTVDGGPSVQGSGSDASKLTQVQLNRRRAVEKEALLREIIAKEPVIEYVQDHKGRVVPDIKGFHRKSFEPPSLREKHQQHKLLRSELDASIKQRERIHSFFGKMELEDEEKAEFRKRQLAKMAAEHAAQEEAEREAKRNLQNLGTTLTQLMAAFNRPSVLEEGVDPDSVEALQVCKYVRRYEPVNQMSEQQRKEALTNRLSSWDHVTRS